MQSHLQTSYYERVLGWVVWDLTICSRPFCWKEVLNACPCCLSGTRLLSTSVLSSSLSQATKKGVGLRGIYHFWRNHKIVCTFTGLKFCATHVWTVVPQSLKFYTTYNSNETLPVFRGYGSETDSCITCVCLYHAICARVRVRTTGRDVDLYSTYAFSLSTDWLCKNPAAWESHHTCSTLRSNFYRTIA